MNIELYIGQIWESISRKQREILLITSEEGVCTRNLLSGEIVYYGPDEIIDVVFHKLIRNVDGTPLAPPKPEPARDKETAVYLGSCGAVWMYTPCGGQTFVQRGQGNGGWTCIGFRFADMPSGMFGYAIGWHTPPNIIQRDQPRPDARLIIATHAVWRRLGANAG